MEVQGILASKVEDEDIVYPPKNIEKSRVYEVYIYDQDYDVNNAMMKSPNGQEITQYDMLDSDYQGGLKLD